MDVLDGGVEERLEDRVMEEGRNQRVDVTGEETVRTGQNHGSGPYEGYTP